MYVVIEVVCSTDCMLKASKYIIVVIIKTSSSNSCSGSITVSAVVEINNSSSSGASSSRNNCSSIPRENLSSFSVDGALISSCIFLRYDSSPNPVRGPH